ncbi:MAG TPA: NAD(P)-dependent oxidoreductase [Elusimicrobiota bacterium]|nr:NAD(P)-dependent oxidoreductase [Elusimicrobiota bacterium]
MKLDGSLILLTGALGWAGRGFLNAIFHGLPDCDPFRKPLNCRLRCFVEPGQDLSVMGGSSREVENIVGDLRDPSDCDRFCAGARDAVLFHVAGVVHPRNVAEFYSVNVDGTKNLLAAAARAGVRRVVAVSSNSPCGYNTSEGHFFDEEIPYRPYRHYGRSKMEMEKVVRSFYDAGRMETVIIRPAWFYGPRQPPRQTLFFRMIQKGLVPLIGNGLNLRSMTYIDNLCQGLLLAADSPHAAGQTFWIVDERAYRMEEIISTVERLLENEFHVACEHRRIRLPGVVADMAGVLDAAFQSFGFYNQKIHVLSEMNKTIACSMRKAREVLGYRPTIALEEGMRRSLAWVFQAQGKRKLL